MGETTESQKRVNEKWRPWFDSLSSFQKDILFEAYPAAFWIEFGGEPVCDDKGKAVDLKSFPNFPELVWKSMKSHLKTPNHLNLRVLCRRISALTCRVPFPCDGCLESYSHRSEVLFEVIIHLNDEHEWGFTEIADWLDMLNIDLSFPMPNKIVGP